MTNLRRSTLMESWPQFVFWGFLEKTDLKALVEAAHYQVFEMSYEKRKIAEALNDGGEHWDIFESPTVLRQRE